MRIERVYELPSQILWLVNESEGEGFRFLARLKSDFDSRVNTFSNDGEALFAVFEANVLIAIGGINVQEVSGSQVGRLRRFYVKQSHRRHGVGASLLKRIEAFAFDHFCEIRLFTDIASAGRFYEKNGYQKAYEQDANYIKRKVT